MTASTTEAPATRETNGSVAGAAILALLTENPDGLTRAQICELGEKTIPRNKAGFYVREGVEWLNSNGHEVAREGKVYSLVS